MGLAESMTVGTIVFVPLVAMLWVFLRLYTYPHTRYTYFNGQKLMMCIAGGMVVGLFVVIVYRYVPLYYLMNAVLIAFVEEMLRLVILNSPFFQMKFDTVFYGSALGGGVSTMVVAGIAYTTQTNPGVNFWDPAILGSLVALSVSATALNVSNGAMVGYGCGKGIIWTYTLRAIIAHVAFNIALIGFIYPDPGYVGIFYYVSMGAILAVSLTLLAYVYFTVIKNALPENLRKQRRRDIMAMAREAEK